jgi:hypothetical protein
LLFSFNKIDPPEADLNFRHFRHFAILGISWGSLILTHKIEIIRLFQDPYFLCCFACQAKRIGLATKTDE